MNTYQYIIIVITSTALVILFMAAVYADIPVHAIPDQAGLSASTLMNVQGIAMTGTAVNLQLGSHTLNDPPLENAGFPGTWGPFGPSDIYIDGYTADPRAAPPGTPLPPGEVQYTAGYNEEMTAVSGSLSYYKTIGISTTNKSAVEGNIAAERLITFIGGDGGRMTTREDILLDGTAAQTVFENQALCPFSSMANPFLPPFCNIVISGSNIDISTGSISTSVGERFIAASIDVPVAESYTIKVKGVTGTSGYSDASGTVSAFMKAHLQEGIEQQIPRRHVSDILGFTPVKAEDLSYSEISTVSGSIQSYTKDMQYQSGIRLV